MPGGNRRGPMGEGPMSGRGMGYCAGYDRPGFANGGGAWGGRGGGRGRRNMYYATGQPGWMRDDAPGVDDSADALRESANAIRQSLHAIEERLTTLEQKSDRS